MRETIDGYEVDLSVECVQDLEIRKRLFDVARTTEITDEEASHWKLIWEVMNKEWRDEDVTMETEETRLWRDILARNGPHHRSPVLTGEITQEEIDGWGGEYERLKNMDFEAIKRKYNVRFERDPYCDSYDDWL